MRTRLKNWLPALVAMVLVAPTFAAGKDGELPVVDGRQVLASVNGEAVTAEDLRWRIGAMHQGMASADGMMQAPDISGLLQRVINAKLIVQEAHQIGLGELPDVATTLEMGHQELLKRFLIDERLKEVHEGDPEVIEKLYRDAVLELKIRSALFQTAEDAAAFETAVRGGNGFEEAVTPFSESGKATVQEGPFLKIGEMRPEVAGVLRELEPGLITAPLEVPTGFAVIQLLEERVPDNPQARAAVEETALAYRKQEELQSYTDELRKRYVKVQEELLGSLDFDSAERDLDVLRADERIVAEVKGAEPVTVKELTGRVERLLFHGLDQAAERNRINKKLEGILDRIVLERAIELEAKRLKLDERADVMDALLSQEESVLFGSFVSRVVNPEIKISDEEVEAYYAEHLDEYMTSAMIRLTGLPFEDREHADAGLEKLRQGSDLEWMRTHADGLVDLTGEVDGVMKFDGRVLAVGMLPEEVKQAVEGAAAGDFRLFAQPQVAFYVLAVQEVYPAQPQAFADVRDRILQQIFLLKREQAIEKWTEDLRKASEIDVYADDDQIRKIVGLGPVGDK